MAARIRKFAVGLQGCRLILAAAALGCALAAAGPAWPQGVPPSAPPAAPPSAAPPSAQLAPAVPPTAGPQPAPAAPPASGNPGLVEEIGKMLKDSASGLADKLPRPADTIGTLQSRAKDATEGLSRMAPPLSPQTVVNGRVVCPAAANGAPDCKAASDRLCRDKGYKEGNSLDMESAEKCPAKVYLSGRISGEPGECRIEHFVTRAICQ